MNCPICDIRMFSYCDHRVGIYKVCYDIPSNRRFSNISEPRTTLCEAGGGLLIELNGLVFLDEERIEKLLLLK